MNCFLPAILTVVLLVLPQTVNAANGASPAQQLMSKLQWRSIGPYIGGRVVAIAGVPGRNLFYMGGVQGGIWKSTNYGQNWVNVSDGKLPPAASSIGALAVSRSNPRVIYAGTGENDIRQDFDSGDGIYKSVDGGETWNYAGLRETHMTSALVVDPRSANVAYAATMGHVYAPNAERGIFKTVDGGKTWRKVLYVDASTGANDVVMDPKHPNTLYVTMWQAQRYPWKLVSGGPGSGLYKTTDGGAHWTNLSKNPGFARGTLGKMGVAIAQSNPRIVYAMVQAREGGVFRSNDAGATWKRVNAQMKLRQRAFYYMAIYVHPTNPDVAFVPQVDGTYKTTDGGKTWKPTTPSGDHHIFWVDPLNTQIMFDGNDGGATVSTDGGTTWSTENNQPTGQYYHVSLDDQFPFHVYGAAQDEGAFEGPSATSAGSIGLGDWHVVALGESTFVTAEPANANVTYGAGYFSTLARLDSSVGQQQNVSPWPRYLSGASAAEMKYRFGWTHPIFFSPADPKELLTAAQVVFSSTDHGKTWQAISPDLTRDDKSTEGPSGGPVDFDQTGAEVFPDIASLAVSPHDADLIWAGSADGLVHVTKDHGAHWALVTPPDLPQWAEITSIEPSYVAQGTAYLTASRYQWDDYRPYVYKTTDYGVHWTSMSAGLPQNQYALVVVQDPREPNLLFAGTRSSAFVSLNGGALWQSIALNLPGAQLRDMAISARQGELVAATHGRAFWILDNLALLEQLARQSEWSVATTQLFQPETAWLSHAYGGGGEAGDDVGENPKFGASVFFNVPPAYDGKTALRLSFLDASGATVRDYTMHLKDKNAKETPDDVLEEMDTTNVRALDLKEDTAVEPGMNVFQWDLRYPPAADVPGFRTLGTDDYPDTSDGPRVVPGTYSVVLQYGATKLVQPLIVQLDPRLHPTTEDLAARLALEMKIHTTIDDMDKQISAAMAIGDRSTPAKRGAVNAAIANLVMLKVHSSEADVLYQARLREQLAFLANEIEAAYSRPTAAEYATYEDILADVTAGLARLSAATR
jgi:photosystem II stability/assembly factor-like uncharacterized protein